MRSSRSWKIVRGGRLTQRLDDAARDTLNQFGWATESRPAFSRHADTFASDEELDEAVDDLLERPTLASAGDSGAAKTFYQPDEEFRGMAPHPSKARRDVAPCT